MRTPAPTTSTTTPTSRRRVHRALAFGGSALMLAGAGLAAAAPAQAAGGATTDPLQVQRSCKTAGQSGTPNYAYYTSVTLKGSPTGLSTYTFDSLSVQKNPALTQISPKSVTVPASSTTTITLKVTGSANSADGPAVLKATLNQNLTTTHPTGAITHFFPMQSTDCGVSYPSEVTKRWPDAPGTVVAVDINGTQQATPASVATGVTKVFAGEGGDFALKSDGSVIGWNGGSSSSAYNNAQSIDASDSPSGRYQLAVTPDGTVIGEGGGEAAGMIGWTGMKSVSTGDWYSVGLTKQGTVGMIGQSECGTGWVPPGLDHVTQVLTGYQGNNIALKDDGTVVTWGCSDGSLAPVPDMVHDVVKIANGKFGFHTALRKDGAVIVWTDDTSFFTPQIVATGAINMTMFGDDMWTDSPHVLAETQDGTVNLVDVYAHTTTPVPSMKGATSLQGRAGTALAIVPGT